MTKSSPSLSVFVKKKYSGSNTYGAKPFHCSMIASWTQFHCWTSAPCLSTAQCHWIAVSASAAGQSQLYSNSLICPSSPSPKSKRPISICGPLFEVSLMRWVTQPGMPIIGQSSLSMMKSPASISISSRIGMVPSISATSAAVSE